MQDSRQRVRSAVSTAERHLAEAGVPSPEVDARRLATFVLGVENLALVIDVPDDFEASYDELVQRRCSREPLQHIVGRVPFRHIEVLVEPGVFIPRPETELVAGAAIDEAIAVVAQRGSVSVVDLCTGTGAIALSVAHEVPQASVVAVDISAAAIALVQRNVAGLSLTNVSVVEGDVAVNVLQELNGTVDVVVSNPPYVPSDSDVTDPEVLLYDPPLALYGGGEDGFALPAKVIQAAARLLRPGGLLVMEHDETQDAIARTYLDETGLFDEVVTYQDLVGRDRFVISRKTHYEN